MPQTPLPGIPVRGSKSGAPLMALLDLLGRSWALGIVWQLAENGPLTFREIQKCCETVSPTVLNSRLKELKEACLIERSEDGYVITSQGLELFQIIVPLRSWSHEWAKFLKKQKR